MLIRSQDGMSLVNLDAVRTLRASEDAIIMADYQILGKYKNNFICQTVINLILDSHCRSERIYCMPKESDFQ